MAINGDNMPDISTRRSNSRNGQIGTGQGATGSAYANLMGALSNSNAASIWSNIPIIGGLFSGMSESADRELAIAQTAWEMAYNAEQAQINRDYQTKERLATQDYNYKMWKEQNEYNSMAARIARAQEAGVNPNAVIADGDTPSNGAPQSSPTSGASASYSSGLAQKMYDNNAMLAKLKAETDNIGADTENKKYDLSWNKLTEPERYEAWRLGNEEINARIDDLFESANLKSVQAYVEDGMYQIACDKSETELAILKQTLNNQRLQYIDILADIVYKDGQCMLQEKQIGIASEQEKLLKKQNQLEQMKIEFSQATGLPYGTSEFETVFYLHSTGQFGKLMGLKLASTSNLKEMLPEPIANLIDIPDGDGSTTKSDGKTSKSDGKTSKSDGKTSKKKGKKTAPKPTSRKSKKILKKVSKGIPFRASSPLSILRLGMPMFDIYNQGSIFEDGQAIQ